MKEYLDAEGLKQEEVEKAIHKAFTEHPDDIVTLETGLLNKQGEWIKTVARLLDAFDKNMRETVKQIDTKRFDEVLEEIRMASKTKKVDRVINYMKNGIFTVQTLL